MTPKVREVLDVIDGVLAEGEEDARELWDILSALRGPDDLYSLDKKERTTVHIRAAAFPKTADGNTSRFEQATMQTRGVQFDPTMPIDSRANDWHFFGHIRRAAEALGLNPEPTTV